jgi:hypothetical protein
LLVPKRAALAAALLISSAVFVAAPSPTHAAAQKVAIIVGPTAISTSNYVPYADQIAATASAAGATVVKAYCANATAAKVLAAVQGANIIVYLGHGNGFPNPYSSTLDPNLVNGWGLANGGTGCTDTNLKYYGEAWITANAHPAAGFNMIYSNACYTPGAGETRGATEATAKARVGYYSRGVLGMGARAYFASDMWQGSSKLVDLILRNPTMTYGNIFKAGNGYSASALKTFTHPNTGAPDQVWIQKTAADYLGTDYWYAFAGNPAETPSGALIPAVPVTRIGGADRYAGAANLSAASFAPGVPVAYLATGQNFPDALALGPVAGRDGGPILLLTRDTIPSPTAAELSRLAPGRIVVLGGSGSVSDAVLAGLGAYTSGGVTRIGGADRYAGAANLSAASFPADGPATVYVVTGLNYPDGLSAGPVAARARVPILLVATDSLPTTVATELRRLNPSQVIIVGGTASVSSAVQNAIAALWN